MPQIFLIAFVMGMILPHTNLAYVSWMFVAHSLVQYPGFFLVFQYFFQGMQKADYQMVGFVLREFMLRLTAQAIMVLICREIFAGQVIYGSAFGAGIGLVLGYQVGDTRLFFITWGMYKNLGLKSSPVFVAQFTRAEFKETFKFGFKIAVGLRDGSRVCTGNPGLKPCAALAYLMTFENRIMNGLLDRERALAPQAARSSEAIYRREESARKEGPRPSYWRDSDRILHSFSFNRYIDKTQVFSNIEDDRISHRVIHVQFLAKIGRFIGRVLGLNEDLIEAIALGHDVGHAPFGHEGEKVLDNACTRHGIGHFHHNAQSIIFLDQVESAYRNQPNPFPGLNLSVQTLDGILCHNGEVHVREIQPDLAVAKDAARAIARLDASLDKAIQAPGSLDLCPMSLEACIVRNCDTISYIGRDIEDAITLGLITRGEIPDTILGNTNRQVMDVLIKDLIKNTLDAGLSRVSYSKDVYQALLLLYDFNMKHIYKHETLASKIHEVPGQMERLFERACDDISRGNENAPVFTDHVRLVGKDYLDQHEANPAIIARDYVAGMTDRYFKKVVTASF